MNSTRSSNSSSSKVDRVNHSSLRKSGSRIFWRRAISLASMTPVSPSNCKRGRLPSIAIQSIPWTIMVEMVGKWTIRLMSLRPTQPMLQSSSATKREIAKRLCIRTHSASLKRRLGLRHRISKALPFRRLSNSAKSALITILETVEPTAIHSAELLPSRCSPQAAVASAKNTCTHLRLIKTRCSRSRQIHLSLWSPKSPHLKRQRQMYVSPGSRQWLHLRGSRKDCSEKHQQIQQQIKRWRPLIWIIWAYCTNRCKISHSSNSIPLLTNIAVTWPRH